MNTQTNAPVVDIDSFLDQSLDDIADLPSFSPLPIGAHRVTVNFEAKKIGEHPAVECKIVLLQTMEMADPTEKIAEPGSTANVAYMIYNEFGVGNLKKVITPIAIHLGLDPAQKGVVRAVIEGAKDLECLIVSGQRKGKVAAGEDARTAPVYMDIKSLQVV